MTSLSQAKDALLSKQYDELIAQYYDDVDHARDRILKTVDAFAQQFGSDRDVMLCSAPGRTEVGGNHTDHQRGTVLAAAVNLDIIAIASPNSDGVIRILSKGLPICVVELSGTAPVECEKGTSAALIRGIAARFAELGLTVGGFDAYTVSDVPRGSGLSSSAAFETLVGTILSHIYNDGSVDAVTIAQVGQFAENNYFGKPCGLMDQMASSVGGFTHIDFADPDAPAVRKLSCNIEQYGFALCIINAGGSHADLTDEYAAIASEMKSVANAMGAEYLAEIESDDFYAAIPAIRGKVSDRALLRAMHFFDDTQRAISEAATLERGDFERFLSFVRRSGRSSMALLQNIYPANDPNERSVSLALAVCSDMLFDGVGAWRIHGGGFAGTVQAFVPIGELDRFCRRIESIFGDGSCYVLKIREQGGSRIF